MGFLGFGKRRWQHEHVQVRLAAIQELTYDRQSIFIDLARSDPDARVRVAAARRITDDASLKGLLVSSNADVVKVARERLSGVALSLALTGTLAECAVLVDGISELKSLAELTLAAKDPGVRALAFKRLSSGDEPSAGMLALVAVQDASGEFGKQAVALISKRSLLKDIARKAKHAQVQAAAVARDKDLGAEQAKPSAEQNRKARLRDLEPLVKEAARLSFSNDWVAIADAFTQLEAKRASVLAQYVDVPLDTQGRALDERFVRAVREFSLRREEAQERERALHEQREALLAEMEASDGTGEEAASAPKRFQDRWASLTAATHDGHQQARFSAARDRLQALNRQQSAASGASQAVSIAPSGDASLTPDERDELEKLSADAEGLIAAADWRSAQDRYRVLHKRWNLLSSTLSGGHPLRMRFLVAYQAFKDGRRASREQRDVAMEGRLAELGRLVEVAEAMATQPPAEDQAREYHERLRRLQADWKAVGAVRRERIEGLRKRFLAACEAAFAPLRAVQEAEDWERFAQGAKAEELIALIDACKDSEDFATIARGVKDAQAAWKKLGPLPRDRRESLWLRFREVCDTQFSRCHGYFAELDKQRQVNLASKLLLLAEAEKLAQQGPIGLAGSPADLADKRAATERLKIIQQEWKAIGPVPREHDQDVWARLRTACDTIFARHRDELNAHHKEQSDNLALKVALCVTAEELAAQCEELLQVAAGAAGGGRFQHAKLGEPPERLRAVKDIQARWKTIGYVPRNQVEPVWTRFRAACDRVYATCKDHLDEQERQRQENLTKKQAIIAEAETLLQHENARWFKDDVKDLQRQWRDIGHVPREVQDELTRRFQDICDRFYAL